MQLFRPRHCWLTHDMAFLASVHFGLGFQAEHPLPLLVGVPKSANTMLVMVAPSAVHTMFRVWYVPRCVGVCGTLTELLPQKRGPVGIAGEDPATAA